MSEILILRHKLVKNTKQYSNLGAHRTGQNKFQSNVYSELYFLLNLNDYELIYLGGADFAPLCLPRTGLTFPFRFPFGFFVTDVSSTLGLGRSLSSRFL